MSSQKKGSQRFTSISKRTPNRPFQRDNDLYITTRTDFRAQLKRCKRILNSEKGELFLHCIGAAIPRGIQLALRLEQESDGVFRHSANTSTIALTDDFQPLDDDEDYAEQRRLNSCLHIRIERLTRTLGGK